MGDATRNIGTNGAENEKDYQAEPIERASNSFSMEHKLDPYVARATERAKIKIRDRILKINGGHIN